MPKVRLENLGLAVANKRGERGLREVAAEIGIGLSTLSRIENGKLPDLETFQKICSWLEIDPGEVLGAPKAQAAQVVEAPRVVAHLRAKPNLDPDVSRALAKLILAAQKLQVVEG